MHLPANLPAIFRAAGLTVIETPGWLERGTGGPFDPVGVQWHHTATGPTVSDEAVARLLINGRPDLGGPLSQLMLDRRGRYWFIAAGRANHAGKARAFGSVGAGDGNTLRVGIEACNNGVGEPWPKVQLDAYDLGTALILRHVTHTSARTVAAHRETSVTGKIDPTGINMTTHRAAVQSLLDNGIGDDQTMSDKQYDALETRLDQIHRDVRQGNQEARALRRGIVRRDAAILKALDELLEATDDQGRARAARQMRASLATAVEPVGDPLDDPAAENPLHGKGDPK